MHYDFYCPARPNLLQAVGECHSGERPARMHEPPTCINMLQQGVSMVQAHLNIVKAKAAPNSPILM